MPETPLHQLLGRELAQRVLDHIAPALHHNVNVMDRNGIIIASRDPARLGTLHRAALAVASTGEPAVISDEEENGGMRRGVNLPLANNGEILGVIGVTGDPAVVRPVAEVLVLTIGLLIAREQELDATARREARDLDLLSRLVNGAPDPTITLRQLSEQHPVLAGPWRITAVLDSTLPEPSPPPLPPSRWPHESRLGSGGLYRFASFRGAFWIVARATEDPARIRTLLGPDPSKIVIHGGPCASVEMLHGSARTLGVLVANHGLLPSGRQHFGQAELSAELAVACLPADLRAHLAARVRGLSDIQLDTLAALLNSGGSLANAGRRLHLHRNTIVQRIERIERLTGLDPRDPANRPCLSMALIADRPNRAQ
ncbi:CdaR family transcriptional regulator [Paeniglutamicibacter gangotriensis]|uniref:Carbohydrate diacid transcriptional regulator n=1 Tax=Paeniglutamicibacter gangotriensis Lz1y TaxID=1276920 RepID=M7MUU5_9MICC|nr:sugar diacid recognition domain-containing protein [Paeniglutamicibacter gangotriensis]EMQ98705.1 carbohydrate diacid transcriptional regulator [Paeniglutamicibacter gangotriensis Lz1y]